MNDYAAKEPVINGSLALDNISIVLINTTHPGNIGAAARAMKAMGLSRLVLVGPADFPSGHATALASGADDILANARVVDTLDEALAGCQFVVGTSARVRGVSLELVEPKVCASQILDEAEQAQVALVFGREDRGMTNEELRRCHLQVHIPTNPDFSSLNLGAAVQVMAYELRMTQLAGQGGVEVPKTKQVAHASQEDMERFYQHLYETLIQIGFLEHSSHEKIMAKLRRMYGRIRPDRVELSILRGILSETGKFAKNSLAPSIEPKKQG
ncbi:tRNA (cytosine(32)/uridine(32)-2'-O)-methyltransferase TrmJ [Endozoicomonas euniceicola]|uniref:tRNA (cytidine/uridine-2'-O-)-methyltransferase TrmJ n=1 Tax=Endozoicomonas euniceicola TaxID=1234143 RepID=A0ABY6GVF2_9GAMM|nr:tRNA (cytosine(32)/uridine(32)-2'-O)-methyltransferase TrmJ [Endozoicomonas euniceicola]UYM16562.1 tRNA (cytosine(32)/uridine(32)-2'-O)-methyltransferase TrmJ [Endozoicomonas euniceicola]